MKSIQLLFLVSVLGLTSCAELVELNQKVAVAAGNLNQQLNADRQVIEGNVESKHDVDTVYVRIKRQLRFTTRAEELNGIEDSLSRRMYDGELDSRGFIHEVNPGVYYQMGDAFANPKNPNDGSIRFHALVTLEKNGTGTRIFWKTRGSTKFAEDIKSEILTAIK